MKGLLVALLVLSIPLSLMAQEKFNQFNSKGKRHGIWKKNFDNGNLRYTGTFNNGKEVGEFKYYSSTNSEHPIIVKKFDAKGIAKVFFYSEKGILESEGVMKGKHRIGKWIFFAKDGKTLISEENYKEGELEGQVITYYPNGQPTEVFNYKNGKIHGLVRRYSDEGIVLDEVMYEHGKRNGLAKYYNTKGELLYSGHYENDLKVGNWVYTKEGNRDKISNR
jgi:antitoxin component YwqK of YwqJK toxin-antitoxin module